LDIYVSGLWSNGNLTAQIIDAGYGTVGGVASGANTQMYIFEGQNGGPATMYATPSTGINFHIVPGGFAYVTSGDSANTIQWNVAYSLTYAP
jgi:hypothetical protein